MEIFKANKLKVNLEKCNFMKDEVQVLGHLLTSKGLKPLESKVTAIEKWKPPSNVSELRSFLGAIGYYRQFIDHYASISEPLCRLLKKNTPFLWSTEQDSAFNLLKRKLITAPILRFPSFSKPFIIRTDASYQGLGGVLLQKGEDGVQELPVHYISRSLTKAERNYSITDLEGAALFFCITKFKPYILGNKVPTIVFTDHKPLLGLFKNKEPHNMRQMRWCLTASMLGVIIQYDKGKNNVVADALSRLHQTPEVNNKICTVNGINGILNTEDETPEDAINTELLKQFLNDKFVEMDGETYFKDMDCYRKVIKDENEKFNVISKYHNIGHEGFWKTYQRIKRNFYWKNMIADIKRYITERVKVIYLIYQDINFINNLSLFI